MSFATGENVGPYRIIEQLGQGGMATVYKAYHAALDRYVALKVLRPDLTEDLTFTARFQREARLVAKLEHPHIVPIHDYAEHDRHPYLVMKFIEGETLKARLGRGPLSAGEIKQVVDLVGGALAYAHRQGILHRDIKPSNVLIAGDGNIYLADFGLARIAQAGESTLSSDSILGTPQYISPEQAMGNKELDEGTDIYSFGVMLYEMVVGQVPFSADTPFAIIHDHIYSPMPLPHLVNPSVPEDVERVLLKALSKDRSDRYDTVSDMVTAFKSAWETAGVPMQGTAVMLSKKSLPAAQSAAIGKNAPVVKTSATGVREAVGIQKPGKKRPSWLTVSVGAGIVLLLCCCIGLAVFRPFQWLRSVPSNGPTLTGPAPSATAAILPPDRQLLFEDDFDTGSQGAQALFDSGMMTYKVENGYGNLSSNYEKGVMPAMYYGTEFGDVTIEFDFMAPSPKVDSQYGLIFRGETAQDGTLDWYYLLGFAPTEQTVIFGCWLYNDWTVEKSFTLPANLLMMGEYNHVVLEARGQELRAFLNSTLVMQMTDPAIENPGVFGFFIIPGEGSKAGPNDYVYFDNLRVYAPVEP